VLNYAACLDGPREGGIAPRILNLLPRTMSVVSIIPREVSLGPV